MNIVKSIKTVWGNDPELASLLSPERVFAGRREGEWKPGDPPYAVITLIASVPNFRTSKGNTDRELFQISIFGARYDEVTRIQHVMRDVLRDATVEDDSGQVVLFEKATGERTLIEGGVTHAIEQFVADISKSRRA